MGRASIGLSLLIKSLYINTHHDRQSMDYKIRSDETPFRIHTTIGPSVRHTRGTRPVYLLIICHPLGLSPWGED